MITDYRYRPYIFIICLVLIILVLIVLNYLFPVKAVESSPEADLIEDCAPIEGLEEPEEPDIYLYGVLIESKVLYKIIECESKFDPTVCNKKYGCSSGIGLGQLTAIAIEDCENNLGVKIDPYNPQQNLLCSLWLFEKYGTDAWGCEDCEWGSYKCWSKVVYTN